MPSDAAYQVQRPARSAAAVCGVARRDASPDSLIFTPESNLSLFSSASASVDRCSFASDAQDRDSLVSDLSMERDPRGISNCANLDPNKLSTGRKHSWNSRKADKVKVQKEDNKVNAEDESQHLDSARNSFSLALKECQDRRSRSEALAKKLDMQRTPSLDLKNVTSFSPRLLTVKRNSVSTNKSSAFPSPGTPTYLHGSIAMPKGWSSERVPSRSNGGRSQGHAAFTPLYSGKTLPSKWEDAERWIFSPVAREGVVRTSFAVSHGFRPKSKSGPLGPPGLAYCSLYSPAVPSAEGGSMGNFMVGSAFSAGVIATDRYSGVSDAAFPSRIDPCIARSISIHGCSETLAPPQLPSQDYILENVKDVGTNPRAASRRDMATQMSPDGSINSSPERRSSCSRSSAALPIMEIQNGRSSQSEVRDLQVDGKVTVTRWSRKHRALYHGKSTEMRENLNGKAMDPQGLTWVKREDARINAWENLQKAKAEAAIRKLEMQLEKKRTSSMEKIMKKLKSAQRRANDMRSSVLANHGQQVSASSRKIVSFRRTRKMASISGCFTCYAI
ncbi:PREDICTED: uncharacterized protein LOC104822856 [Tarenaya hassleriana]|uniref:uncharacterized protein LOC104822856 n=1 Tax=Tarenaya hassleriana TaxID=28532 RepID=UPI00053CA0DD|nr:PREDICTED: uncharacterized protein LOC104822856 [Tarenaya hassleriana]